LDGGGELSRSYQKRLLDRFHLVNQRCDVSREPVTFNSVNKLWLGGTDILDYGSTLTLIQYALFYNIHSISVVCYATQGNPAERVPDHWHYVSFGLSNIHGDANAPNGPSGLGFELTFRLKGRLEGIPPAWPVDLLQKLARYIHLTSK
jgi:suppressor of fused-like protein